MKKPINLYESLVEEALLSMADGDEKGVLCDAAAMALNDLPPHYHCRSESMSFITPAEWEDWRFQAQESVRKALAYVRRYPRPQRLWGLREHSSEMPDMDAGTRE